jgi:nickel transport protein
VKRKTPAIAAAAAFLLAAPAVAHEVLHSIERGRAVAVKAYFADGGGLAYAEYQVFSPADPKIPYQKGRMDRAGYLAFVPDRPGDWHVRVVEAGGHGLELDVPVAPPGSHAVTAPSAPPGLASWAFALRPIVGVALIGGLFATLVLVYRRKARRK